MPKPPHPSRVKKSRRDQIPRFSFSCSAILFYPLIQLIKAPQTTKITPPSIKSSPTGPNTNDNPAPKTKINTPVPSGLNGAGVDPAGARLIISLVDELLADEGERQLFEIFAPLRIGALNQTAKLLS